MSAERTIAIGDVHGCHAALKAVLDVIQPRRGDRLVFLGDLVDRGPDSKGVIDTAISLSSTCDVVSILGNHEEMLLTARSDDRALRAWLSSGGAATLDSYGFATGPSDLPAAHEAFFESMLPYYETKDHIFLHASYDPNLPMAAQSGMLLRWTSLRDGIPVRHVSGKTVVVGHTPQMQGSILDRGYIKGIDTGCYKGGWLTALDVNAGTLWQANPVGELRAVTR